MPWSSHTRRRFSRSCRYSLLRARDLLWLSRMRARLAFCYIAARHGVLVKNWIHIAWVLCVHLVSWGWDNWRDRGQEIGAESRAGQKARQGIVY